MIKNTIINIKKVLEYGKQYKKNLIGMLIAAITSPIVGIVIPILSAKQIVYFTSNTWKQVVLMSFVILIVQLYNAFAAMYFTRRNSQYFTRGTMKNLQIKLTEESLKISQSDIDKNSTGIFTQRIINDTEKMARYIGWGGLNTLRMILTNVGTLISTFILNKIIFLYYLIVTIILTYLHIRKTKLYGKEDIKFRNETEKVSSLTNELIRGIKDIKVLNSEKSFIKKLENNIINQNQKRFEMAKINMKYKYIIDNSKSIFEFILIILLIYLIKDNKLTIPVALALLNYKSGIMTIIIEKISDFLDQTNDFNISCNRVFNIIENNYYEKEKFGKSTINKIKGDIEFKNVSFSYEKEKEILKDISFKIPAGNKVGIIGKSGTGKTTIFNLIAKLYNIDKGEILIDNININTLDKNSLRGNITIINQEPYIFNLSIKENFKIIKNDIKDEEIEEACKIACLDEYINSLPNKYDTIIGESGVMLSGGQKQRLAIARAFVQKTKIILFDEATSNLDNDTQFKIQKAINNLSDEYTIIMIAHRLSTIINCDKILLLDNGKIIDKGKHEELLARNDIYKSLCKNELIESK